MGAMSSFDDFMDSLKEIESDTFLEEISEGMGEVVKDLIQSGFQSQTDPYGNGWAPRRGTYAHPPLDKSGEMKGSFLVGTNATGVKVTNPTLYSPFQQYGTRTIDARAMLPDNAKGLGDWDKPLRESADATFKKKMAA